MLSKRKNLIIIVVAVLCGLMGIILVMNYVGSVKTVYTEVPSGTVVVCAQNIPQNVRITRDMIRAADMQTEYILPQTFTKPEDVVGSMTKTAIYKGEQIIQDRVSKGDKPGEFSYGIPEGKRAVTIALDPVKGVSGFIRPHDRVDVLATIEIPEENSGSAKGTGTASDGKTQVNVQVEVSWAKDLQFFQKVAQKLLEGRRIVSFDGKNITFTLFQNIEVLAVGNTVKTEQPAGGLIKANDAQEKEAKTITFCLDPEQIELLANAEKVGALKLDLRNPGDDRIVDLKPIIEYKPKLDGEE